MAKRSPAEKQNSDQTRSLRPLTRDCAIAQLARLELTPVFLPAEEDQKRELLDIVMRHFSNAQHLEAGMTKFIESTFETKNVAATLVMIAAQTRKPEAAPPGCDRCNLGIDFETGMQRWAAHVSVDAVRHRPDCRFRERRDYDKCGCPVYASSKRCPGPVGGPPCQRGTWLRRKDDERKANSAGLTAEEFSSAREAARRQDAALLSGIGAKGARSADGNWGKLAAGDLEEE